MALLETNAVSSTRFAQTVLISLALLICCSIYATGQASDQSKLELIVQSGHANRIYATTFSDDGKILGTGSSDNSIKLWDVASGEGDKLGVRPDSK